jgi:hypothetical protein
MMNVRNSIPILLIVVYGLLTGCTVGGVPFIIVPSIATVKVPLASPEHDVQAKSFDVEPNKSNIYVYRNEVIGHAETMSIALDGRLSGKSASKTYFMWVVEPGEHEVTSLTENTYKISVNAKAGENHFIWQEVKFGIWEQRSKLHEVAEDVGRKGVLECKLIQHE